MSETPYQKQTNRRLEGLEKNVELILKVLNNFVDDMEPEIDALKSALHMNREKQREVQKEFKNEIKQMKLDVEDKVEEVQKTLENKKIITVPKEKFTWIKNRLKLK